MKTLIRRLFFCILLLFLFLPPSYAQNYLYVSNPQATWEESIGVVNEATISVKPQGIYTEIGLFLTLSSQYKVFSPEAQLEIVYDFALPKNSLVTDSWLWVGDSIVKADIRDRWSASFIYEGIVQRQQDPSILYKLYEFDGRPVYQLRVYPLFEDEVRKVKITYLVPTTFSATGQNISLPMDMLTASGISPDNIRLLVWPDQDWQTPQLSEEGSLSFERKETLDGQPYLETELSEYFGRSLSLDFPSVLQEGIYLKTFQSAADNYYQLVYLPDLDEAIQPRSKTAFILDYVQDPTTVSREEYLRETSQFLLANLSPSDSFNVIYPTLTANQASNSWMAATEENIEQVMATVGDRVRSDFSLLPSLLNTAFSFIGTDESAGIFLLASSDEFETVAKANTIVEGLQESFPNFPNIYIADLANKARYAFWANGINYYGNQYLYTLLTQLSGGEIASLSSVLPSMSEVLRESLVYINGSFESFDLHTSVESGFCYARFSLDPISQVSPYSAIRQVGKFEGDLPFEVSVAGEFNDSLFFKEFSLFPLSASTALDSLTKSMWAGMQIGAWEEGTPTNDLIQKIMSLSLESRVLSEYTAFLALEPSDTTAPCLADECIDETALPVHIDQLLATELEIKIGPNPFKEQLIVRGKLIPGSVTPTIRVFDLMGRVVSLLLIETEGEEWRATWDGSSSAGHSLPTGVYLLKVEVNGQSVLRRIIKQ